MFTLYIDLSYSEAIQTLLTAYTDEPNQFILIRPKATTANNTYSFEMQRVRWYINSFKPIFYGTIRPYQAGAVIDGYFRMHPITRFLIYAGILFNILGFLEPTITGIVALFGGQGSILLQHALINALILPAFGTILVLYGRFVLGASEEKCLRTSFSQAAVAGTGSPA